MFLKNKERRLQKRHVVCWDALVEATFPDFQSRIRVKVLNFSIKGALLHSEQISVDNRHLFISAEKPDLILKISLPDMVLESKIDIRWYRLSNEKKLYEIGIGFVNFLERNRGAVDKLMEFLKEDK
jgi:hypothetical protein